MNSLRRWPLTTCLAALALFATPLHAINYDVEVIIFEHIRKTTVGSSNDLLLPVTVSARSIPATADTAVTGQQGNGPIQALQTLRLQEHANRISRSKNHRLLYHGGWRQPDFSQEDAPYVRIALGPRLDMYAERSDQDSLYLKGSPVPPVNSNRGYDQARSTSLYGGIKVWVGRFLHFDTLLAYTPRGADFSFPFKTERRMRSRQLHYLDNSRVGIITKIFPVDETAPN